MSLSFSRTCVERKNNKARIPEFVSHLLVNFAEDFSGGFGVEEADDDPRVLPLQVRHGRSGVLRG